MQIGISDSFKEWFWAKTKIDKKVVISEGRLCICWKLEYVGKLLKIT